MISRVVVVGDVMLDVIVRVDDVVAPTSDTASSIHVARGGAGANLAVALVAAGHDVAYVGAVGDDAAGRIIADALERAHVVARLERAGGATGTVVSLVAPDGQRAMLRDRGANPRLSTTFALDQLDVPFDHLHVSGYVVLEEATRELATAVLARALVLGASTSVDVCSVAPLRASSPARFLEAVRGATMLFANEEEALELTGSHDVEAALESLAREFGEVMVTTGARGAHGARGDERRHVPAESRVVLDTTGAGDAAAGAYLGARLGGRGLSDALTAAMVSSARVVAALGAEGYSLA